MNVSDRIAKLRSFMEEKHIDAYVVRSADNHQSEYVGEHFKSREFTSWFYRFSGNRCNHKRCCRSLDRRTLFYSGGSAACREWCNTLSHG